VSQVYEEKARGLNLHAEPVIYQSCRLFIVQAAQNETGVRNGGLEVVIDDGV
jgi:hypothetical protein